MALPDPKSKRYDRQIRIWGAHGQQRLEACRVLLLNCGPTGSETLKNLVLGGIGSFTIVDGSKVSARDLGNNFFVHASNVGESRAQVVTGLLRELNDAVQGSYVEESPEVLIENNPSFFQDFDLIIATQVRYAASLRLAMDQSQSFTGADLAASRWEKLVGDAFLPMRRCVSKTQSSWRSCAGSTKSNCCWRAHTGSWDTYGWVPGGTPILRPLRP